MHFESFGAIIFILIIIIVIQYNSVKQTEVETAELTL